MHRLRPHSRGFTLLLGALTTLASFATDMGLPVLAEMAGSLGIPVGRAALSLSVFMAGFALGPLAFGPAGVMYAADSTAGKIYALDLGAGIHLLPEYKSFTVGPFFRYTQGAIEVSRVSEVHRHSTGGYVAFEF